MPRVALLEGSECVGRTRVREGTSGIEVGQQDLFVRIQDLRRLRHEVHPGENNDVRVRGGRLAREPQRIANEISQILDGRLLVIVCQKHGVFLAFQPVDFSDQVQGRVDRFIDIPGGEIQNGDVCHDGNFPWRDCSNSEEPVTFPWDIIAGFGVHNGMKQSVLFLCTHNSARSQLAEALLRHDAGHLYNASSAGTERTLVKPEVLTVLSELGVDTTPLRSKTMDAFPGQTFDVVVTVCDSARETCPYAPGRLRTIHRSFPDPSLVTSSEADRLQAFRDTRDAIRVWLKEAF